MKITDVRFNEFMPKTYRFDFNASGQRYALVLHPDSIWLWRTHPPMPGGFCYRDDTLYRGPIYATQRDGETHAEWLARVVSGAVKAQILQ